MMYLVNGDTADWAYARQGWPPSAVELPPGETYEGAFFNSEEEIAAIFSENLPAMLYLVDWTLAHPNPVPEFRFYFSSSEQPGGRSGYPGTKR